MAENKVVHGDSLIYAFLKTVIEAKDEGELGFRRWSSKRC